MSVSHVAGAFSLVIGSDLGCYSRFAHTISRPNETCRFNKAVTRPRTPKGSYKTKFGVSNPNLKVLSELRIAGVKSACVAKNLIAEKIDPKTISKDVTVASDALIVLMAYQNDAYALMSF